MKQLFHDRKFKSFKELFKPRDILLLDRGFRDCSTYLEEDHGPICHMPVCLPQSQKQLTTFQANVSRFVTKYRWVVEVINSHLKRSFKALSQVKNSTLLTVIEDYRIAGALINKFFSRLISNSNEGNI